MTDYPNPPFLNSDRPSYARNSTIYDKMIAKLHYSAHCANPRSYDPIHHSMETRTSKLDHAGCGLLSAKYYSGRSLEETELVFWNLVRSKYTNGDAMIAIFFRDNEPLIAKSASKKIHNLESKANFLGQTPTANPTLNQPYYPPYPFPMQFGPQSIYQTSPFMPMQMPMPMPFNMNPFQSAPVSQATTPNYTPSKDYFVEASEIFPQDHFAHNRELVSDKNEDQIRMKAMEEELFQIKQQNAKLENQLT